MMRPFVSKAMRVTAFVMKMLLGVLFLVSALSKLYDIDTFEMYVFTYGFFSLNMTFIAARLVIVAELLVAIGLLSNVWNKFVNICTLLMLVCFTLFLGYAALIGRDESCQCMGPLVEFNPIQSILKNAVLLLWLLPVMRVQPWKWRPKWYLWLPAIVLPIVAVFVYSAPDNWLFGPAEEVYNADKFDSAVAPEGDLAQYNLDEGRHVVAFVTPGCPFCKMADEKLTYICRRNDLDSTLFLNLMPTKDTTVVDLTIDSTSFLRPTHEVPLMTWALITYGQRPIVFLVEDGKVSATCHYRNISEQQIVDFLSPTSSN